MTWTDPVPYPNSLEQNDPEGALNTYVIDNIQHLYDTAGITLLYEGTGSGTDTTPFLMENVLSSSYSDYRIYVDYISSSSTDYPVFYWSDGIASDAGQWSGHSIDQSGATITGASYSSSVLQIGTDASTSAWCNSVIDLSFTNSSFDATDAIVHIVALGDTNAYTSHGRCSSGVTISTPTGIGIGSFGLNGVDVNVRIFGLTGLIAP